MSDISLIEKYFPSLNESQKSRFSDLKDLYITWNNNINVISRKDMDLFYEHHVLHSLSIAKFIEFKPGTTVMDIGTGGGFPGIPLAILFPDVKLFLIDSIGKKIKVVNEVAAALKLTNVETQKGRAEEVQQTFDFVITRAVAAFPLLKTWCNNKIKQIGFNEIPNGIIALKGGDLVDELKGLEKKIKITDISTYFTESYFETKKIVYLPLEPGS